MKSGLSLVLVVALAAPTGTALADQLVVRLDALYTPGREAATGGAVSTEQRVAVPNGLPRTLRLPLAATTGGGFTLSLRQQDLDGAVERDTTPPAMRVRVLSTGVGSVSEDATGRVAVGMDTALIFDDLVSGKSRTFDVRIRGDADGDAAYGVELPISIEAWRRADDGRPVENPSKKNRAFWGMLPGHFEP